MKKIIVIALLLFASCAVIRRPGGTIDSTIVTRDSMHIDSGVTYHNRTVRITHASEYTIKPVFWYVISAAFLLTGFFIIRNNR